MLRNSPKVYDQVLQYKITYFKNQFKETKDRLSNSIIGVPEGKKNERIGRETIFEEK